MIDVLLVSIIILASEAWCELYFKLKFVLKKQRNDIEYGMPENENENLMSRSCLRKFNHTSIELQ